MRRRTVVARPWAVLVVLFLLLPGCGEASPTLVPDRVQLEPARFVTVTDELEGRLTATMLSNLSPARRAALMEAARQPPALVADPDKEFDALYLDMVGECDDVDVRIDLVDGVATVGTDVAAQEIEGVCGLAAMSVVVGVTVEAGLTVEVGG